MSKMVSRLLVFAVAAAWLASSTCNARNDMLLMSPERVSEKLTFYPVVPFDTAHATRTRYKNFIENVREEMLSPDKVYGISRLQNPANLQDSDRFLLVALYSSAGDRIILAIDRADASVVGYRSQYEAYFFTDTINAAYTSSVFSGISRTSLPFNSSYSALEKEASQRANLKLGMRELDISIQHLDISQQSQNYNHAKFLLVASQMVSDAVRLRYVENAVVEHITQDAEGSSFYPSATMIGLEDNWKEISKRIQEAVYGVINPGLVLPGVSKPITSVYPMTAPQIGVIMYVCDDCPKTEPTINIIGRNGFCADVQDSFYYDGNPLILWQCRSTNNENQLFKLLKDGTIQCKGKCLTAYRLRTNRYVMIHNCSTVPKYSGVKWEIKDNGNIINKESNLALTADTGYNWDVLTVDETTNSSRQGWSFKNTSRSVEAIPTPIATYNGMYMQASGNDSVQVVQVSNDKSAPQWEIYPDGTVRPSGTQTNCLARKSSPDDTIVGLHLCDGGTSERWLFNHDGTVSDASRQHVLEVNSDQQIVLVKPSADTPTTKQIFVIDIKFM